MATNVTEKDKTLQEIIDWCEQLEIDGLRLANALLMQRDTTAYGVVKGQIDAYGKTADHCRSMLGYSGSMLSCLTYEDTDNSDPSDPPHLRNAGETSYMAQKYGCLDQETWKADLKTMFSECFRVLKEHGVLIFKWNETQIPVSQILKLTAHKPLFGNKQPNRTGTHWIVFMKEDAK